MTADTHVKNSTALVIVDVQNDFCPGGSLACDGGDDVASAISDYMRENGDSYAAVVGTKDWHIDPGDHFSENPDFVHSGPVHCKVGTRGAQSHPNLDTEPIEAWFLKGEYTSAYSGCEGHLEGSDQLLAQWMKDRGITHVDVYGIATGYCVKATALDLAETTSVRLLPQLCAHVAQESADAAIAEMKAAGVTVACQ